MRQYTQEQRIIASSHISPDPASGFYPAEAFPEFTRWTKPPQPEPPLDLIQPMREQPFSVQARRKTPTQAQTPNPASSPASNSAHTLDQPSYATPQDQQQHRPQSHRPAYSRPGAPMAAPTPRMADPSVFIVMAEINSRQAMKFLHALQKLGHAQRIGDTLWLVKTDRQLAEARDYLASTLTKSDRLFILDSRNNRPAWHNIGADMDARIREFWSEKL